MPSRPCVAGKRHQKPKIQDKKFLLDHGELHPVDAEKFDKKTQDLYLQIQKRQNPSHSSVAKTFKPAKKAKNVDLEQDTDLNLFKSLLSSTSNSLGKSSHATSHQKSQVIETSEKDLPFEVSLNPLSKEESFDLLIKDAFKAFMSDDQVQKQDSNSHSYQTEYSNFSFSLKSSFLNTSDEQKPANPIALSISTFHNCLSVHPDFHIAKKSQFRDLVSKHIAQFLSDITLLQARKSPSEPDSGFTRPKVLILCPMRGSAHQIIHQIMNHLPQAISHHQGIKRFDEEFGGISKPEAQENSSQEDLVCRTKGQEYCQIFQGNCDDSFLIGLGLSQSSGKAGKIKLFTSFDNSDCIVASPVALRQACEAEGTDFLSSLQIIYLDSADVILMQNWDHLEWIIAACNKLPSQMPAECDFSRLRSCFADGKSASRRQFIASSSLCSLFLTSLFNRQVNAIGVATFQPKCIPDSKCSTAEMKTLAFSSSLSSQSLNIFQCKKLTSLADTRFETFFSHIWKPMIQQCSFQESRSGHIMIFISCYFDWLRIKSEFDRQDVDYESLTEYTTPPNVTRIRGWFFNGQIRFLLVTERFFFYNRYKIRGAKRVIFYSLPEFPSIFTLVSQSLSLEAVKELQEDEKETPLITVLATRADSLKMERIYGTRKTNYWLSKCTSNIVSQIDIPPL